MDKNKKIKLVSEGLLFLVLEVRDLFYTADSISKDTFDGMYNSIEGLADRLTTLLQIMVVDDKHNFREATHALASSIDAEYSDTLGETSVLDAWSEWYNVLYQDDDLDSLS